MKWAEFKKRAFPLDKKIEEDNRSIYWKINRYIGLRFAFLFNWLGFSANALSFFRFLLILFGLYFIHFIIYNIKWFPIIGAMLIIWQVNLDFADGALARAQGTSSKLGELLDGLANAFFRSAIIILMGFFTNNIVMLILSLTASFILVSFSGYLIFFNYINKNVKIIFKRSLSVVAMNVFIPFLIIIHVIFNFPIFIFSYFIVVFYTLLASVCLFTLVFTKNKMSNNK
jgi:phosphatidylglycerophosphate synthase